MSVKDSSINKGETLLDTITTINSMGPDALIVRHPEAGISKKISKVVNDLNNSFKIALVSDAGTPCISDPGFRLISYIKENNLDAR